MSAYPTIPTTLKRAPTPSNLAASAELSRTAAREAVRRIGRATTALHALSETEHPSSAQMVAAVAAWTAAQDAIQAALVEVAAAAVLGGAAVSTTARGAFGVRPQTLSVWLQSTAAQLRGLDLEKAGGEWKPVHASDLRELDQGAMNGAGSVARDSDSGAPDTTTDAAGAHGASVGAQVLAAGDVDPQVLAADNAELQRLGIDMREVEREALGGELA
ncbi:hypothetical protein AXK57_19655 [Tsukamurella pulmonis]|uniref:hypothetical protein n=1 Tax=Tsukamurella pulmonis TaxID=47312 RepID=UPI00079747F4|nr:hypothetical protein [Tsukamurella pulmonis]KXP12497.1 hypothetical protein AXK57_19655 [Tsukamurella pulmonis]